MTHTDVYHVSPARPLWTERERKALPSPEPAHATITKGQLPTPLEKGLEEPAWKLSGVLDEAELQLQQEEKTAGQEEAKFVMVSEIYQQELESNAEHHAEVLAYLNELEASAQEEQDHGNAAEEEENEGRHDEIEDLVRELRMQSLEHGLRQVEGQIHTLHQTSLKADREWEHESHAAQELYMESVLEQQERVLEEQEEEKQEACLGHYDLNRQLDSAGDEAIEAEADQNEQRKRRKAAVEHAHAISHLGEEEVLEALAREQEEEDRRAHIADLVGSVSDGKEGLRMIIQQAKKVDDKVQMELKERHDIFATQINEQVLLMHVEAEKARRREWAKRDLSFHRSSELLHKARDMISNLDAHVERLDSEFQAIVERRDVWPPGPSYTQPHQRTKVRSAGAKFDEDVPTSDRPGTAPLRNRSANRREMLIRLGRSKAPTGFSYAVRIVFEHMDKDGKGDLNESEMLEGLRLLGLDTADVSLVSVFNEFGKDASSRIDFKDFEEMALSVLGSKDTRKKDDPVQKEGQKDGAQEKAGE
jgi:hypothetical protein